MHQTQTANEGGEEKSVFGGKTVDSHGVRQKASGKPWFTEGSQVCVHVHVCMTDKHKHPELNERPEQKPAGSNPHLLLHSPAFLWQNIHTAGKANKHP